MRKLKCVFMFGLVLLLMVGCSKEEIQPEPLNAADDVSLKSAKSQQKEYKGDHFVPFKATFELTAFFEKLGPIIQYDFQNPWPPPNTGPGGMHLDILGSGKATHLGRTYFEIQQWWTTRLPATDKISYGQGTMTFTAANGDELFATYYGTADHTDDPPTEILTYGTFIGGTGRFENAEGTFVWDGLFVRTNPTPNNELVIGDKLGTGTVIVTGKIRY